MIGLLILVVAVFCLVIGFIAGRFMLVRQNQGEALVANALTRVNSPNVLINNVTLPTADGTTQIDHILITESGLFVLETKHYSGWIFGDPKREYWTQVIYRKKSRFLNPLRQNYGHLKTVQGLFKLPDSAFIGAVVFSGDCKFKTDVGSQVISLDQLLDFINKPRPKVLDEKQMAYAVGRIEMKRLRRSLETDEYHANYVRSKISRRA